MQKLNIPLMGALLLLSLVVCPILYIHVGPALNDLQLETLKILGIIAGCSALYCFLVGEITGNNSQVDKIWSLLPIAYCWIIAAKGGMHPRLVVIAVLVTLWGIRLTYNFARKGAYKLRFWEGEEDYRWEKVRAIPFLQNRAVWMAFDFFFISGYQNALILMFTFPALVCMGSTAPFGWVDAVAAILMFEAVRQAPYNKGFNTIGLWNVSRHPNYFAEQSIWVSLYIFSIGAGVGIVNWSMIGALLLIVLFAASTNLVEGISGDKYPEYAEYCKQVNKFFPGKKYNG